MSKPSGWVPIDKGLVKYLPKIDRPYSPLEAMFSYTVDVNCGRKWSINGYAELWKWNRKKVARFIKECGTDTGHIPDKKGTQTGHPIHFIDEGLWGVRDNNGARTGQERDKNGDTTINPNPNPNPKEEKETPFRALNFLTDLGVEQQKAKDFLKNRKAKRLANTLTAFNTIQKEITKTGLTPNEIIHKCCDEGWGGFKASWLPESKVDYQLEKERKALGM